MGSPIPQTATAMVVAAKGGTLVSGDGLVAVTMPPLAWREDYTITLNYRTLDDSRRNAASAAKLLTTNRAFVLELATAGGQDVSEATLGQALRLAVRYTPSQVAGILESSLGLYRFDVASQQWRPLDACSRDTATDTVSCTTDRGGVFILAGTASATEGGLSPWLIRALAVVGVLAVALVIWAGRRMRSKRGR